MLILNLPDFSLHLLLLLHHLLHLHDLLAAAEQGVKNPSQGLSEGFRIRIDYIAFYMERKKSRVNFIMSDPVILSC